MPRGDGSSYVLRADGIDFVGADRASPNGTAVLHVADTGKTIITDTGRLDNDRLALDGITTAVADPLKRGMEPLETTGSVPGATTGLPSYCLSVRLCR
ncbi:hypothetical protein AB4Z38_25255 [Arthrobacter sp. 2RAF6]|uniref:hypothetical protein n=1 Tax=Arthrobacter sp. 2RAF6 TaxID=3233002 RepID=UPI003F9315A2